MSLYNIPIDNYVWVPVVLFSIIMVIGTIIGFVSGWKRSLYFLSGNLILGIAGILVYPLIYDNLLNNIIAEKLNYTGELSGLINLSAAYIGAIILLAYLLLANLLLWFIYIFIRRYLKIHKNTRGRKRTLKGRMIGMTMGATTSFLIGITVSNVGSAIFIPSNTENAFARFSNSVLKTLSLGKMYDTQNIQRLLKMSEIITKSSKDLNEIKEMMTGNFSNGDSVPDITKDINTWNKHSDSLSYIFQDYKLTNVLLSSLPEFDKNVTLNYTIFQKTLQIINKNKLNIHKLDLDKRIQDIFTNYFTKIISITHSPKSVTKAEVLKSLISTFID